MSSYTRPTSLLNYPLSIAMFVATVAVSTFALDWLFPAPGSLPFWGLVAVLFAATWLLSWVVCKPFGLLTAPMESGYDR